MESAVATAPDMNSELVDIKVDLARLEGGQTALAERMDRFENGLVKITESVAELTAAANLVAKLVKPALIAAIVMFAASIGHDLPLDKLAALFQ